MPLTFRKTNEPYGWCSNMSPHPVVDEAGVEWRTAEHWFQAARFTDYKVRDLIRQQRSPMGAKMCAKAFADKMAVVPQSMQDLTNMLKVLRWKVAQHPELAVELLATGDREIIEDVTSRPHGSGKFWGAALVDGRWEGRNVLGEMWMRIRAEMRRSP